MSIMSNMSKHETYQGDRYFRSAETTTLATIDDPGNDLSSLESFLSFLEGTVIGDIESEIYQEYLVTKQYLGMSITYSDFVLEYLANFYPEYLETY